MFTAVMTIKWEQLLILFLYQTCHFSKCYVIIISTVTPIKSISLTSFFSSSPPESSSTRGERSDYHYNPIPFRLDNSVLLIEYLVSSVGSDWICLRVSPLTAIDSLMDDSPNDL